ncbi:MAG: hypothetical protein FWG19_03310 [Methanomassiliicoccaceae archaeon]|nr:hypothetical protein [Methanomassiliicoccaceae archaeon]
MAQLSMYMETDLYEKVKARAKEKGMSFSGYVSSVLVERLAVSWPEGYFDLIGSITDETFQAPEELPPSLDAKREKL